MIKNVDILSYGPISQVDFNNLQNINLVMGRNGTGKTVLLKSLYASVRAIEQNHRGNEPRSIKELLFEKLYWTFQTEELGKLVKKGYSSLNFRLESACGEVLNYTFGESTTKTITNVTNTFAPRDINSIFIPAKEILSLQNVILRTRDEWHQFGFDNTYYDLATALKPTTKGRNYKNFSDARRKLNEAIGGRIEYEETKGQWLFRDNQKRTFSINLTAEGIKKISILDALLGNHYLSKDSIIFIDEPESALHPELVSLFMEIIALLADEGLQFFIATHSYFVIKKLYLLSQQKNISIPTISFEESGVQQYDIKEGIPENAIINESIRLYEEEIDL